MARLLKYLAILLPAVEIVGLLLVGEEIGVVPTLLLLLAGIATGMIVIRWLGAAAFREFQVAVRNGAPPLEALRTGALTLGAGVLFIIPGFASDILAILLLARAAWLRLRRPPAVGPDALHRDGGPSADFGRTAKIVDAEFVIVEKEPGSGKVHPTREAP